MKIIDKDEREAHKAYILTAGFKGMFYGAVFSVGLYTYLKAWQPGKFSRFNTSIKTAILTMPTISAAAFFADEGSVDFDREMYSSGQLNQKVLDEFRSWNNAPVSEKMVSALSNNKHRFIFSAWIASLYGSWVLVNRNKVKAGLKPVKPEMYARAFTIVLLLSTIVLAMKEKETRKEQLTPFEAGAYGEQDEE